MTPHRSMRLWSLIGVFGVFVFLAGCTQSSSNARKHADTKPPNIVFIFGDDIGFGDVGVNGNKTFLTPNIDKLAAEGTNFLEFTVASPVCSPSRAAMLTGQYPDRNSVFQHFYHAGHHEKYGMPDWLPTGAPSIANVLKDAGYKTGHFGKWHLTNSHIPDAPEPKAYGFDSYAVFNGPGPQTDAVQVFEDALDFITDNQNSPFFLNLWIHETHTPHYPDPKLIEAYKDLDEQTQMYAATMSSADAGVGAIRNLIDDLGLAENTIVIFSSDNGPERTGGESTRLHHNDPDAAVEGREPLGRYFSVGETAGLRGRKRDLYEGGVRVPFIMSWPGVIERGAVNDEAVLNAIDLFPTFAAIAGAPLPASYAGDGQSFDGLLRGEGFKRNSPLFWQRLGPLEPDGKTRKNTWASVRDGAWKYYETDAGERALYNIETDRAETEDLAVLNPEKAAELSGKISKWQSTLPTQIDANATSQQRQK